MTPEEHALMRDMAAQQAQDQFCRELRKALHMASLPKEVIHAVIKFKAKTLAIGTQCARDSGDEYEITGIHDTTRTKE